jgi:hypothetical protein
MKACVNCKWIDIESDPPKCGHESSRFERAPDYVYGKSAETVQLDCMTARAGYSGRCGPEAKFWEARE